MAKAYSYIRFSSYGQARGDSLRRQLEMSKKWASDHNLVIDEEMSDLGVSAFRGKHRKEGALSDFLELVQAGKIEQGSVLIVESLDRLSREEVLESFGLFASIVKAGIRLVTLADGREYFGKIDIGDMMYSIVVMSRAHEESMMKSERVGKAWLNKRNLARTEGKAISSVCPAWLKKVGDRYEIIPERATIVQRIFEELSIGIGRRQIVKRLNADGIESWGGGKQGWHDSYIQRMLDFPSVVGWYQPYRLVEGKRVIDGEPIKNFYPTVIEEDLYWKAKGAAEGRKHGGGRKGTRYSNLLTGIGKCGRCGAGMTFINKGSGGKAGHTKLVCNASVRGNMCGHKHRYRYISSELAVFFGLGGKLSSLSADARNRLSSLESELAGKKAELEATRKKLRVMLDIFDDEDDLDTQDKIKSLQQHVKGLRAESSRIEKEIRSVSPRSENSTGAALLTLYKDLSELEGNELYKARAALAQRLRELVNTITFLDGIIEITYKDGSKAKCRSVKAETKTLTEA